MRTRLLALALIVGSATALPAQNPPPRLLQQQQLQQQVIQRFLANFRAQAGLTDEQFGRFQSVIQHSFQERADLVRRERELWVELEGEMRPGVAANSDNLSRLMDQLVGIQTTRAEQARADLAEYRAFLNPVQTAQLLIAWQRLEAQIEGVRGRMMQRRLGVP